MTFRPTLNSAQKGEESAAGAVFVMIFILVVMTICFFAFGWSTDEARSHALQAVEDSGYADVRMEGPVVLACDQNDVYRWRWEGTNPAGKRVKGQACAGWWFKGWTVRLER